MKDTDTIRRELATTLPVGIESAAVMAHLDREGIEHSALVPARPTRDHQPAPGEQVIHAALREPARGKLVGRTVTVDFRFDTDGRLAAIDVRDQFTGP